MHEKNRRTVRGHLQTFGQTDPLAGANAQTDPDELFRRIGIVYIAPPHRARRGGVT